MRARYSRSMNWLLAACAVVAVRGVAAADPPKPLADLASAIGNGSWTCDGTALLRKMSANRTSRIEMGGTWMHDSVEAKLGNDPFHFEVYTSYDSNGKHFHRVMIESDGSIGEGSPFHAAFGYYAQGVAEDTATLPAGWRDRLVPVHNPNTRGATGLCLEPHDLVISKYVAGREKDDHFVRAALEHRLVDPDVLRARLAVTPIDEARRTHIAARIARDAAPTPSP